MAFFITLLLLSATANSSPISPSKPETQGLGNREANAPVTIDSIVFPTGFPELVPTKRLHYKVEAASSTRSIVVAETPVTLRKRGEPVTIDGVVWSTGFPDLVPPKALHIEVGAATSPLSIWVPTTTVELVTLAKRTDAAATIDGIVYPTGFPDLVPSSKVTLTTYTAFAASPVSVNQRQSGDGNLVAQTADPVTIGGVVLSTGMPELVPTGTTMTLNSAVATATTALAVVEARKNAGASMNPPVARLLGGADEVVEMSFERWDDD